MLEPEVKFKLNRMLGNRKVNMDAQNQLKRQQCKHMNLKDYTCQDCQSIIPSFKGSLFDTGGITTFLNIKYVNDFVDQIESNNNGMTSGKPKVIYENYKPKNVQEMREYILYSIDKSLIQASKRGQLSTDHLKILGTPGCGKNLSSEIVSYLVIKKNREKRILGKSISEQKESGDNNKEENIIQQKDEQVQNQQQFESPYSTIGPYCLLFDSFFECGNLERAEYITPTEYNLYLNVDTNTKGHQQWFYFKVKNTFKDKKYTFNIRNFTKPFSLHRSGMKIMMKSKKRSASLEGSDEEQDEWQPMNSEIQYWRSDIQRSGWRVPGPLNLDDEEDDDQALDDINGIDGARGLIGSSMTPSAKKQLQRLKTSMTVGTVPGLPSLPLITSNTQVKKKRRYFYCLTFTVQFEHDDDKVYFAYSRPYQYSKTFINMITLETQLIKSQKCSKLLNSELKVTESSNRLERQIITRELVYDRKIFAKSISGLPVPVITLTSRRHKGVEYRKRQGICITARVHPGETNSNFVFDGVMRYLLSQEGIYNLLQTYVFKLIPCMNPDGNVCGNYRSSLAGVDLNRQWVLPNKDIHPIVYKAKELMANFSKERNFLVFCDLHCHSKKMNSFIYGCNTAANGGFTSWTKTRLLPRILAKQTPLFNFKDCRFRIDPDKLGTARVIVWREFGVTNSFTLENSFYGYQLGTKTIPFQPSHYLGIGEDLLRALIEYRQCLKQIEKELIDTKGWLKPKLLLEVTGTPAAQKFAEEEAERLKNERKQKKIEQYRQNIGLVGKKRDISPNLMVVSTNKASKVHQVVAQQNIQTRNVPKGNSTLAQQILPVVSPKTDNSSQEGFKNPFQRQNSNKSETKQIKIKNSGNVHQNNQREVKHQSSSDSTNDLSLRKLASLQTAPMNQQDVKSGTPKLKKSILRGNRFQRQDSSNRKNAQKQQKSVRMSPHHQNRDSSGNSQSDKSSQNNDSSPFPGANKISVKLVPQPKQSAQKRNSSIQSNQKSQRSHNSNLKQESMTPSSNWRNYFMGDELEQIFEMIEEGEDPNEEEDQMSLSDDNASEDNLDVEELYQEVYLRGNMMNQEIIDAKNAEQLHQKQIIQEAKEAQEAKAKEKEIANQEPINEVESRDDEEFELNADDEVDNKSMSMNQEEQIFTIDQESLLNKSIVEGNMKISVSKVNTQPLDEIQYPMKVDTPAKSLKSKGDDHLVQIEIQQQFLDDSIQKYHQVFDTSQSDAAQMLVNHRPQLMYTFVNQMQYAHIGQPAKVIYRKSNAHDLRQSKNGFKIKSYPSNLDTGRVQYSDLQFQNNGERNLQNHQNNPTNAMSIAKLQNNGFSQYIQHQIKSEKQTIQQAYQKIHNKQADIAINKFTNAKLSRSTLTNSFYNPNQDNSVERLPQVPTTLANQMALENLALLTNHKRVSMPISQSKIGMHTIDRTQITNYRNSSNIKQPPLGQNNSQLSNPFDPASSQHDEQLSSMTSPSFDQIRRQSLNGNSGNLLPSLRQHTQDSTGNASQKQSTMRGAGGIVPSQRKQFQSINNHGGASSINQQITTGQYSLQNNRREQSQSELGMQIYTNSHNKKLISHNPNVGPQSSLASYQQFKYELNPQIYNMHAKAYSVLGKISDSTVSVGGPQHHHQTGGNQQYQTLIPHSNTGIKGLERSPIKATNFASHRTTDNQASSPQQTIIGQTHFNVNQSQNKKRQIIQKRAGDSTQLMGGNQILPIHLVHNNQRHL